MKIALFANVHANLPAFEALLQDLDSRKPDAIYCLGDLIGYNIWPNEVIGRIRNAGIPTVAGDQDYKVRTLVTLRHHLTERGDNYPYHLVTPENREYLITLPLRIRLDYRLNDDEPLSVMLEHGRNMTEPLTADTDDRHLLGMLQAARADILCLGNSQVPFYRIIATQDGNKHIVNIGSVGKPIDAGSGPCYVILTLTDNSSVTESDSIKVEFVRLGYAGKKAAASDANSPKG